MLGIAGSALVHYILLRPTAKADEHNHNMIVVDGSPQELFGSAGHDPDFIGQFNDFNTPTALVRESVLAYEELARSSRPAEGLKLL